MSRYDHINQKEAERKMHVYLDKAAKWWLKMGLTGYYYKRPITVNVTEDALNHLLRQPHCCPVELKAALDGWAVETTKWGRAARTLKIAGRNQGSGAMRVASFKLMKGARNA